MSKFKAGFIGCGNMGFAIAEAVSKVIDAKEKAEKISATAGDISLVAKNSEFIFIAVKPQNLDDISASLCEFLENREDKPVIVSMLAGVEIEKLKDKLGADAKIIRIMPNTPVSVGEGMILMSANENVTEYNKAEFLRIMEKGGVIEEFPEKLIDAGTAISGCGPAFCFMFADALADGGVLAGIPKDKALSLAIQTMIGSARLMAETGMSPAVLKDKVTSPGGSTIEGVKALEEGAFRATVINAAVASYEKTKKLGK